MRRFALGCLAVTSLAAATACGGPWLKWRAQPAAPTLVGKVSVAVTDHRVSTQGGDDPRLIGSERGALFIPNALRLDEPTDAANAIRDLVGQAALTAGIGVAPADGGGGGVKIAVELSTLWCEGLLAAITRARLGGTEPPVGPVSPGGPPNGPVTPGDPCSPAGPVGPSGPVGPATPVAP